LRFATILFALKFYSNTPSIEPIENVYLLIRCTFWKNSLSQVIKPTGGLKQELKFMSTIDIVLGALLIFGMVRGFMKGLSVEVASIIALIAGVYGAIHFSHYVATKLDESVDWDQNYINVVAFGATFLVIIVLVSLAGKAFTKLADFASLGILNKLLGGVFGALKFGLIASVLLIVFAHANSTVEFIQPEKLNNSVLYKPVKGLATMIFPDIIKQEEELREELMGS